MSRETWKPSWIGTGLLCLILAGMAEAQEPADPHREVRGVTISCQTWGWEWGSDAMLEALDAIQRVGANWVTIHPYARIRADGRVQSRLGEEAPVWLTRPIAEAQRRGLKIFIKPHLAYWGSPFSWRGEITFQDDAAWDRFFRQYEGWIVRMARMCAQADGFCVGTELDKTVVHEARWRRIIRRVRAETRAPLTYAANWTDYQRVGFWDALDVIGVQAYFPLVDHEKVPSDAELRRGWERVLQRLSAYAASRGQEVLFTELGYDRSPLAALRPWESARGPQTDAVQRRCLAAALAAVAGEERVVGAFLWKWFAGPAPHEDFLMSEPPLRQVIAAAWKARAD